MRTDLGLTDVTIVLLTAKGQEADRRRGVEVGADVFLTKPFDGRAPRPGSFPSRSPRRGPLMAKEIRLRKLVRRDEVAAVLAAVSGGEDAVVDAKGRLWSARPGRTERAGRSSDGTLLGSVTGPHAAETAGALSALVGLEQERRELADEVLDMYREVNLLYALGEVLATAADRADLAARTLEAARQVAVDAAYVVLDVTGPTVAAAVGDPEPATRIPADLGRLRIETDGDGTCSSPRWPSGRPARRDRALPPVGHVRGERPQAHRSGGGPVRGRPRTSSRRRPAPGPPPNARPRCAGSSTSCASSWTPSARPSRWRR